MAHRETTITLSDIQNVVDQIVARFHPDKSWLFGSFAHGTPTSDSDVDLLIAMDTALQNVQQAVEIRKAVDFPFPVDLLVRTPEQLAERLALGDGFFRDVLTKGIVLHEATDTRHTSGVRKLRVITPPLKPCGRRKAAKQSLPSLPDLDALIDELRFLTSHAVEIRYPGTFAEPQDAETCWQTAVQARDLIRHHLGIEE